MGYRVGIYRFFLGLLLLTGISAHAMRVHFFDIDGTLVHDSGINEQGKRPGWWRYWVLPRMKNMNGGWTIESHVSLSAQTELPAHILVTRHELDHLLVEHLGTGEGKPGSPVAIDLMEDPAFELSINRRLIKDKTWKRPNRVYPGFYYIQRPASFRLHEDLTDQDQSLLDTYTAARARVAADPSFEWKGEAFPAFQKAMAGAELGKDLVYLLTDSGPSERTVSKWMTALRKDGELSAGKSSPRLISTSSVQGGYFASYNNFDQRKPGAIAEKAAALSRSPLKKHLTLSPDFNEAMQGVEREMHEIIVYENSPEYVRNTVNVLKELAVKFPQIKFILLHGGLKDQVSQADFNRRGILTPESTDLERGLVFTPHGKGYRKLFSQELHSCEDFLKEKS